MRTEISISGDPPGYCCLGGLCAVAKPPEVRTDQTGMYFEPSADDEGGLVPSNLLDPTIARALAHLNDNRGQTFAQIADMIEANPNI